MKPLKDLLAKIDHPLVQGLGASSDSLDLNLTAQYKMQVTLPLINLKVPFLYSHYNIETYEFRAQGRKSKFNIGTRK